MLQWYRSIAAGRRNNTTLTAFVSGQEQQIFLPEMPTLGAAAAAAVSATAGAGTCCRVLVFGGSGFDPDDPMIARV